MCEVDEKEYMPMWWASVPAELYKLRAEGRLCDITIVVGGVLRYSVHSLVLVSASSHFKASLNAGSLLQEYYLQDADEDCFKHLMDYIYGRNLVLNKDNVHAILSTAKALYIDSAILHCEEYSKSLPHRELMDSSDSQQSCKLTNKGSGTNPSPGFNNSLQLDTSTSFSSDFLPGYDVDTQRVLERGIKQEPDNFYPGENTADTKNNDAHVTYEPITVGGKTVAMRSVVHESSSASKAQSHGNKFGNSPPDADKPKNKSLEFICAQLSSKRNINGQVDSDILENDIDDSFSPNSSFSPIRHASDFPWQHQHLGTNMRFGTCSHLKSTPVRYSELPTSLIRREKDKSKYISTILNLRSQNSSPESMSRPFPTSSRNSIDSTNAVWSTENAPSIVVSSSSMSASNILQSTINSCNSGGVSNVEAATSATMPLVGNVSQVSGTNTTNVNTLSAATNALLSSVANQQAALQSLMLNMSGGTLPGLPGLLPFGLGGNLGSNSSSQPLASHSGIGLGNFNSQFSNQLPSQALQCLSALTANAQALGQLLPPLPTGILPSQMMQSQMATTNESQTLAPLSTANASNQTQDSTQSTESSHVNVPDSSTESCAAATRQPPPSAEEENPSSSNSDDITPGQSTALPGIFGLNPSETSAAAINQTLQQQGLPSLMLPPTGQNLINVNMAGVNPVLPMALFMLPNGGLGPNLMLPSSQSFTQAGLKQESDHPGDDDGDNDMDIRIRQNHSGSSITMFDCPICHKPFPNTKQRAVHMRIHSKYEHKPFVCDVCGFRTKYADRLRIHKRLQHTHKGIKPFKCPYCPYATSLKGNCRKHVMNKHPSCAVMVEQVMPI